MCAKGQLKLRAQLRVIRQEIIDSKAPIDSLTDILNQILAALKDNDKSPRSRDRSPKLLPGSKRSIGSHENIYIIHGKLHCH